MLKILAENWVLKLFSLVFALILWFFVMGERRLEIGFTVPLELKNLPAGLILANEVPSLVDVRLNGPRTLLMNLSAKDISIAVDLGDLNPGVTSFKRLEERLNLPSGIKVTRLSPSFVDVKLERLKERKIPVKVVVSGMPAEGHLLGDVSVSPSRVQVSGAEGELKDIAELVTTPVSVEGVNESFSLMVPLDFRGRYTRLNEEEQVVEVQVEITAPAPVDTLSE